MLLSVALLLVLVLTRLAGSEDPVLYTIIMGASVVVPLARKIFLRRFDLFELDVVFLLLFGLSYVWRAAALIRDPTASFFSQYWRPDGLWFGCYVAALAICAFNVGYALPIGSFLAGFVPRLPERYTVKRGAIVFIGIIGVSCGAYLLHAVILGGLDIYFWSLIYDRSHMYVGHGWLTPFQGLALVAVPFGYVYLYQTRSYSSLMLLGSLLALCILAVTLSRGVFLTWIVVIAVIRHYTVQRLNVRYGVFYAVMLLLLSFLIQTIREAPLGGSNLTLAEKLINSMSATFSGFDTTIMVVDNYPNPNPFFHGKTIFEAYAYPWIPRAIWTTKPTIYGGTSITEPIGQFFSYGTHINSDIIGELYANFSVLGVFLGMLLQGLIGRTIYVALVKSKTLNRGHILLYGYLVALVPGWQRIGAGSAVYYMLQFIIPIVTALYFVHMGRGPTKDSQHSQVIPSRGPVYAPR